MESEKSEENNQLEIKENYHGWKIWVASENGYYRWIISKYDKDGKEIEYWDEHGNYSQLNSALIAARKCCLKLATFLALNQYLLELRNQKKLNCHEYDALHDSVFTWIYQQRL